MSGALFTGCQTLPLPIYHLSRQAPLQHEDPSGPASFSPSVARIAASTTRDWADVDSWLASKLPAGRAPPSFERNSETLKALLSLSAHNEAADDERLDRKSIG